MMFPRMYGKIRVSQEYIKDCIADKNLRRVLSDFVIVDAKSNYAEDYIEYTMFHESFRNLKPGEIIPEYKLIITQHHSGYAFDVQEIKH